MIADKQAYPDMHFDSLGTSISKSYAFWICIFWAGPTLRKCAFFPRKNAYFLHIFCIFQQKVRKSSDFVGYAFWICIFGAGPTLRNVHFFEEKCILFAYFLYIPAKSEKI